MLQRQNKNERRNGRNRGKSAPPLPEPKKKPQAPKRVRQRNRKMRVNKVKGRTVDSRIMKSGAMGFAVDATSNLKTGTSVMTIPSVLHQSELVYALLTYASNVFFRGTLGANSQTNNGVAYNEFVEGLAYLGAAIQTVSKGATAELTDVPEIFDVLTALLTEKKVKLNSGIIHYTPAWDADFDLTFSLTTPTGTIYTLYTPSGANVIPVPFTTVVPSQNGYAALLRASADDTFGSRIVGFGTNTKRYSTDPSCYARNYNYFGASGEVGSLYSESELEVPFKHPYFAKFVAYDPTDAVVSRVFSPQSGSIVTPIGLSLTSKDFLESQLENRIPVQYKFLDFNSFYAIVGSWLVAIFEATPGNITGNTIYTQPTQFPFSINEFQWLLRQAILSVFPEQCHGQFVAPVKSSPSNTNSVFQPFIVDSISSSNPIYSKMQLPLFLVENLNMLKSRIFDTVDGKGKTKRHNWVPVWGVYSGDAAPVFQFTDANGVSQPLFNPITTMPFANIWDATGLVINTKVSVNNFLPIYLEAWNTQISGYGKHLSTKLSVISADNSKIASLLPYTRILAKQGNINSDDWTKRALGFVNPVDEFITNKPSRAVKRSLSEKKIKKDQVEAIPPATLFELETRAILSQNQLSEEVMGAINYFLIPSIRLNYSVGDLLTMTAYQIYTGEVCNSSSIQGLWNISQPEIYRLFSVGTNLSAGMFAAEAENDVLTKATETMSDKGLGLDFLKALMGGISSVIPVVGPIISGLLSG